MENDPYQLNEVYENTFESIILISQTPFCNEKRILIQLVLDVGLNFKLYCHNTLVLEVWNISYVVIGEKYHISSMLRSSQVL